MLHIDYVFALFTVSVALAAYIGQVQMTIRERISDLRIAVREERRFRSPNLTYITVLEHDIDTNKADARWLLPADMLLVGAGLLLLLHGLIWFFVSDHSSKPVHLETPAIDVLDTLAILFFALSILYLVVLHIRQWSKYFGASEKKEKETATPNARENTMT